MSKMFENLEHQGIRGVYEVGGRVRDELLGLPNKDIDYAVEAKSWDHMKQWVEKNTDKVFLEKPEFLTIRALTYEGEAVDFVMCRRDGAYSDSRRPDEVFPGTIYDDLARRDFTVNAIAKNVITGEYLDPWDGKVDLENNVLRCVGNATERLSEDPLRILRAVRFWITKGLQPDSELETRLRWNWGDELKSVSASRRREELERCFRADTLQALRILSVVHPSLVEGIFADGLWLKPTLEKA